MRIAVTGAAGGLGGAAVESLLGRGVAADQVVATSRDTARLSRLRERGVVTRRADYTEPASLRSALEGVDRLLLVSSNSRADRVAEHRAVIEAAAQAGVGLVAYTSLLHADTATSPIVDSHARTERVLRDSGLPYVILRNGQYLENYFVQLPLLRPAGALHGTAGDGLISGALRSEYGEAAATVLVADGHDGAVYELGGDEAFTLPELARSVSERYGEEFGYVDHPAEELAEVFAELGLPAFFAPVAAQTGAQARRGELVTDSGDLSRLIGHPTTSLRDALAQLP